MSTPERIINLVTKVRKTIGSDMMLAVDVGYRFNEVSAALKVCQAIEELDICFLETPFPVDFYTPYAELAKKTSIPIAMGEHAVTRAECLNMIDYGGVSVVQPYVNTVGGMTEAKRVVDGAKDKGASVIPGNWSSQILGCASVHLAAYSAVSPYIEYAPAEIYNAPLRQRIQELGFPVVDGVIKLPKVSGIGFEVKEDLLKEFKLDI
jgi:L-alanine-DL-glutamate epimerase-like enolase superfamily enzyme